MRRSALPEDWQEGYAKALLYAEWKYGWIRDTTHGVVDAREIVDEVIYKHLSGDSVCPADVNFWAFVRMNIHREVFHYRDKFRAETLREHEPLDLLGDFGPKSHLTQESREWLLDLLKGHEDEQAVVAFMLDNSIYKPQEIAQAMMLDIGDVYNIFRRLKRHLGERLRGLGAETQAFADSEA